MGSHYKRPLCPVYVVQSESHYSCLWAADANAPPPDIHAQDERLPGDPEPDLDAGVEEEEEERPRQLADGEALDLCYFDQARAFGRDPLPLLAAPIQGRASHPVAQRNPT